MTTTIPNPPANPIPYTSTFEGDMTAWLAWLTDNASKFGDVSQELNDMLNLSMLGTTSDSATSLTIVSSGTINFTMGAGKGYKNGMVVKLASKANPTNYMKASLTAYNSTTGASAGTVTSKNGTGTFADWSVFFDTLDPTILSVPTGEAVAAGSLLGIDDAGNSMNVDRISTAILQAVTATSIHACNFGSTNTAIFWTAGSTDVRMMTITKTGTTGLASTSVATGQNSTPVWSAELTNGNILLVYTQVTTGYPVFKILSNSGTTIVAETVIEAVAAVGQIKCCALGGGGFAVNYNVAANNRYAVYTNAGGVTKASTNNVTGAQTRVAICSTAAGGFVALAGTTALSGRIYDAAGTSVSTAAIDIETQSGAYDINIASRTGSIAAAGRRYATNVPPVGGVVGLASDTANTAINNLANGSIGAIPNYRDLTNVVSALGNGHVAALPTGNYVATLSASGSNEYPRYVVFNGDGCVVDSGICFDETTYTGTPIFVIPKDTNGFSLIWLNSLRNIKFAQVKTGKLLGISLGQAGSTTMYNTSGEVVLSSISMLNVGNARVNYERQGRVVVM